MRLRSGTTPARAIEVLGVCVQQFTTATQVMPEPQGRAYYWELAVSTVERNLRAVFEDVPLSSLRGERFWAIVGGNVTRVEEAANDEREHQIEWLKRHETRLSELQQRFPSTGETFVVPDTNALLHFRTFDEVPWISLLGGDAVRLVIPLRVVDELDAKKYARRGELGDRARVLIQRLAKYAGGEVRLDVRLEILAREDLDPDALSRPAEADTEIIELCEGISAYAPGGQTRLVTGDYGMTIRARGRGLSVFEMPENLLLRLTPTPQAQ